MGILRDIRRHASIAQGNFGKMFRDVRIAPMPEALARILEEVHAPEPDLGRLEALIVAEPELSVSVLGSVNSSLFALRAEITSVRHALALLGLDRVRPLVTAAALVEAVPRPDSPLFDHRVYWTDTLLRALTARELTTMTRPGLEETVFTAALTADVAVPVLLDAWGEYYEPILEAWRDDPRPLAEHERERYDWDHGEAGAWILRTWDFPDSLIDVTARHAAAAGRGPENEIVELVATASRMASAAAPDPSRCLDLVDAAADLGVAPETWPRIVDRVARQFDEICAHYRLTGLGADRVLDLVRETAETKEATPCP